MLDAPFPTNEVDAAKMARAVKEIHRLARTLTQYEAEQTEAFLAAHRDLKDTHVLGSYPLRRIEDPNGSPAWAIPKVLLPRNLTGVYTFEKARQAGFPTILCLRPDIVLGLPRG